MTDGAVTHTSSFRVGASFALPDVIRSLGHSPASIFAEAGVDLALYAHPENRIAARDLGRVFVHAAQVTGRLDIALLMVQAASARGLGLVDELVAEGPDVRTALHNLVRLLQYNTLAGYPVLSVSESIAILKFELRDADFPGSEFILEAVAGIRVRLMRRLCGGSWRPLEVHLGRRAPPDACAFRKFFDAPIRFSATEDALLFSAEWLRHHVPNEQRRLHCQRLRIAAAPCSEQVRRQVAIRIGFAPLGAAEIAHELGVSRRQLFRRLRDEGTTFHALVDEFRFARARHMLATGDAPLAQVAFALAFPEQSAFTRAFARWSGMAPREWRRLNRPEHRDATAAERSVPIRPLQVAPATTSRP